MVELTPDFPRWQHRVDGPWGRFSDRLPRWQPTRRAN